MTRTEMVNQMVGMKLEFVGELFEEETIIISKQEGREEDYQIYADEEDSEIYCVVVKDGKIVKVW